MAKSKTTNSPEEEQKTGDAARPPAGSKDYGAAQIDKLEGLEALAVIHQVPIRSMAAHIGNGLDRSGHKVSLGAWHG